MILLSGIIPGVLVGIAASRRDGVPYEIPGLNHSWLVLIAFVPQYLAFYLPATRSLISSEWASTILVGSQALLALFCVVNIRASGFWILGLGLLMNLVVIIANGGLMPISPETASHLIPAEIVDTLPLGERFGLSKNVLLLPSETQLPWLSDHFLLPDQLPYQVAFSPGDVLIALGAFWFFASRGTPLQKQKTGISR